MGRGVGGSCESLAVEHEYSWQSFSLLDLAPVQDSGVMITLVIGGVLSPLNTRGEPKLGAFESLMPGALAFMGQHVLRHGSMNLRVLSRTRSGEARRWQCWGIGF